MFFSFQQENGSAEVRFLEFEIHFDEVWFGAGCDGTGGPALPLSPGTRNGGSAEPLGRLLTVPPHPILPWTLVSPRSARAPGSALSAAACLAVRGIAQSPTSDRPASD